MIIHKLFEIQSYFQTLMVKSDTPVAEAQTWMAVPGFVVVLILTILGPSPAVSSVGEDREVKEPLWGCRVPPTQGLFEGWGLDWD